MTTQRKKEIEDRMADIEKEIENEIDGTRKVILRREYQILNSWQYIESRCAKDGIVEVW